MASACWQTVRSVPLPAAVSLRPKTGFGTPVQLWLERDKRLQRWKERSGACDANMRLGEALGLSGGGGLT